VLSGARDSRAQRCTKRGAPVGRAGLRRPSTHVISTEVDHTNGRGQRPLPWGSQAPWGRRGRVAGTRVRPRSLVGLGGPMGHQEDPLHGAWCASRSVVLQLPVSLSLSLALSLFLRIARAGAGHRWKRISLPPPEERPADARHPSLVSPAPAVTGARCLVLSGARESRAPLSTPRGVAVGGASRGPRQRCLATAGRFPARRVTRRFQRRLASATRVSENLNRQQRRWARFSGAPDFRRVRRWSRLRSGSPPYVGVWRPTSSLALGHLWASRRPTSLPLRASPSRASRGCPP
jgi:hypothetical protein